MKESLNYLHIQFFLFIFYIYANCYFLLQHAHANSVGYFITQDSSFGNLILPVLPRLPPPVAEK